MLERRKKRLTVEAIAVELATDPSPRCIGPGTADPIFIHVGKYSSSPDGNPEKKPKTVSLQSPDLHSLLQ